MHRSDRKKRSDLFFDKKITPETFQLSGVPYIIYAVISVTFSLFFQIKQIIQNINKRFCFSSFTCCF